MNLTWEFVKLHPWLYVLDFILLLAIPINEIFLPHIYGKIVEGIHNGKGYQRYMVYAVITIVIVMFFDCMNDIHRAYTDPKMEFFIREKMASRIIEKHEGNYQDISSGDIITKLIRFPQILLKWFDNLVNWTIPYSFMLFFMSIYFFMHDKLLGVCLLISMILIFALLLNSPGSCATLTKQKDAIFFHFFNVIEDIFSNMISIYTCDTADHEMGILRKNGQAYGEVLKATILYIQKFKILSNIVLLVAIVVFFTRAAILISKKEMKIAAFVSLFTMLTTLVGNLRWVIDTTRDVVFDYNTIRYDHDFDFVKPPPRAPPQFSPPDGAIGMAEVKFKGHFDGQSTLHSREILTDINFRIKKGEHIALVGDIGSGKSTILKILAALLTPYSGHAYLKIGTINYWYESPKKRKISYVPQVNVLFDRSLYDNLIYGNPNHISEHDIKAYLEDLDIWKEFAQLPQGLHTPLGKNGSRLSGGQRQLVWCIRAILQNPDVLLLDEPTSSMDEKTKKLLMSILEQKMKDSTVIMVTHDPLLEKFATRSIRIHGGKVVN